MSRNVGKTRNQYGLSRRFILEESEVLIRDNHVVHKPTNKTYECTRYIPIYSVYMCVLLEIALYGRLVVNRSTERTWSSGSVGTRSVGRRSRAACAPLVLPAATIRFPGLVSLASGRSHRELHKDERKLVQDML